MMLSGSRWILFSSVIALSACGSDHPAPGPTSPEAGVDGGGGAGGRSHNDGGPGDGGQGGGAGGMKPDGSAPRKDTTPPMFMGISKITAVAESAVRVSWAAATDNVTAADSMGYRVYRAAKSGQQDFSRKRRCGAPMADAGAATRAEAPCYVSAPSGSTSVVVGDVLPASEFFYVARALDAAGNEDSNTAEATFTTDDQSPPDFGGVESVAALTATSIDVNWGTSFDSTAPDSAMTFDVFVKAGEVPDPDKDKPAYKSKPGEHEAVIDGLDPLTTYKVIVRAVDPSGNVDANTSSLGVTTPEGVAPTFDGLKRASAEGNTVRLFWLPASDNQTDPDNIVYDVYSSLTQHREDFSKPPRATSAQGAASITLTEKNPATRYYYIVRARDFAGNQDANISEKSALTGPLPDTKAPTFNGATAVASTSPTSLDVTWNPAADDTTGPNEFTYQVFVSTTTPVPLKTPAVTVVGLTGVTVLGLTAATTYDVVVLAQDAAGNTSAATPFVSGKTMAAVAGDTTAPALGNLPTVLMVNGKPDQLTASWAAATDAPNTAADIRYHVCVSTVQADCTGAKFSTHVALTTAFGTNSATLIKLLPRTKYFVDVRAEDRAGNLEAVDHGVPATTATSWTVNAKPILFNHCVSCHDYDNPSNMVNAPSSYIQIATEKQACAVPDPKSNGCQLKLVDPAGRPEFSLVYRRINPLGLTTAPFSAAAPNLYNGAREPRDTLSKLTTEEDSILRDWITQGAFAN